MKVVSIVGVGLIGASFGLALRKAGFQGEILGVSSEASVAAGLATGAIDRGTTLEEAARTSDLLYLAQPIDAILQTLTRLQEHLRADCLVTDAGSTKTLIARTAATFLPAGSFLGGHPMAGKERRGAQAAEAELFAQRPYVLTGTQGITSPHVTEFRLYLRKFGAQIIEMSPEEHDRTVALTSHLPQLLSTTLAAMLGAQHDTLTGVVFGPGLLDMTRLALSSTDVWQSILATNKEAVEEALSAFEHMLQNTREALANETITELFERGSKFATSIRGAL